MSSPLLGRLYPGHIVQGSKSSGEKPHQPYNAGVMNSHPLLISVTHDWFTFISIFLKHEHPAAPGHGLDRNFGKFVRCEIGDRWVIGYSPSSSIQTSHGSDSSYPVGQIQMYSRNIMVRNMQKCKNKSVLVSDNTTRSFLYRSPLKSLFTGVILMPLVQVHQAGASKQDGTEFLET